MYILLASFIGYLFGCTNGSQLVGKHKKVSVKQEGMKNAGATNTTLVLGLKYGLVVLFVDITKAILALLVMAAILKYNHIGFEAQIVLLYVTALFVVIGHNFPITMKFDGGKGTASLFGILLYIDWKFAFLGLFILLLFSVVANYFVIGTFMVYVSFLGFTGYMYGKAPAFIAALLLILFFIKHAENFMRIINKEEVKVTSLLGKEAS